MTGQSGTASRSCQLHHAFEHTDPFSFQRDQWPEGKGLVHMMRAGGSAKQARDRRFQAILPLRGKILNVERTDDATLYKNSEISNLIIGLGLGVRGEAPKELRYGKVRPAASLWDPICRLPRTGPQRQPLNIKSSEERKMKSGVSGC